MSPEMMLTVVAAPSARPPPRNPPAPSAIASTKLRATTPTARRRRLALTNPLPTAPTGLPTTTSVRCKGNGQYPVLVCYPDDLGVAGKCQPARRLSREVASTRRETRETAVFGRPGWPGVRPARP